MLEYGVQDGICVKCLKEINGEIKEQEELERNNPLFTLASENQLKEFKDIMYLEKTTHEILSECGLKILNKPHVDRLSDVKWLSKTVFIDVLLPSMGVMDLMFYSSFGIDINPERPKCEIIAISLSFDTDRGLSYIITDDPTVFKNFKHPTKYMVDEITCDICCEDRKDHYHCGRCDKSHCSICYNATSTKCPYCRYSFKEHLENNGITVEAV
jgi:hypothetical protein